MPVKASNVKAADPGLSFILHNLDEQGNPTPFDCPTLTIEVVIDSVYTSSITINPDIRNGANSIVDSELHLIMPFGDSSYNNETQVQYEIKVYWPGNDTPDTCSGTAPAEKGEFKPGEILGRFKTSTVGDDIYFIRRKGRNSSGNSEVNAVTRQNVITKVPRSEQKNFNDLSPSPFNQNTAQPNSFNNNIEFLLMPNEDILVVDKTQAPFVGLRILSKNNNYNVTEQNPSPPLTIAQCEGANFLLCNYDLLVVLPSNTLDTMCYFLAKDDDQVQNTIYSTIRTFTIG